MRCLFGFFEYWVWQGRRVGWLLGVYAVEVGEFVGVVGADGEAAFQHYAFGRVRSHASY